MAGQRKVIRARRNRTQARITAIRSTLKKSDSPSANYTKVMRTEMGRLKLKKKKAIRKLTGRPLA